MFDGLPSFHVLLLKLCVGNRAMVCRSKGCCGCPWAINPGDPRSAPDRTAGRPHWSHVGRISNAAHLSNRGFLAKGISVFSPNFRSVVNYGAAFRLKNALSQRRDDRHRFSHHARYCRSGSAGSDGLDPTHRFRAASIGAPATDWITYLRIIRWTKGNTSDVLLGTPWEVPENYARHGHPYALPLSVRPAGNQP